MGHIEDIAVNSNQQGKKLGLRIIQALKFIGAQRGCYKVILDCSEKVMNLKLVFRGILTKRCVFSLERSFLRKVWF